MFNPKRTAHAKFHHAQTITLSVMTAGLTLWKLWRPFFPGSAVLDPDNPVQPFAEWGVPVNQVTGAVLILPVLAGSYLLESRRLGRRAFVGQRKLEHRTPARGRPRCGERSRRPAQACMRGQR